VTGLVHVAGQHAEHDRLAAPARHLLGSRDIVGQVYVSARTGNQALPPDSFEKP